MALGALGLAERLRRLGAELEVEAQRASRRRRTLRNG